MSARLLRLCIIFATYIVLFFIAKLVFLAVNSCFYSDLGVGAVVDILLHGYRMDQSMAAYLTSVPAIVLLTTVWCRKFRWSETVLSVWRYLSVFLIVAVAMLDSVLYGYWQFKLDTTPIFYFLSSPAAAMASVDSWVPIAGSVVVVGLSLLLAYVLGFAWKWPEIHCITIRKKRMKAGCAMILCLGLLFVAIRGGVTVSTMNPSAAYFSNDTRMNHAAVNPMFSLIYSATHSSDFSHQFRFFDDERLAGLLGELDRETMAEPMDSVAKGLMLRDGVGSRPDVYLIILESFSSHLMPSMGGEPVAMRLDSIAREGVLFDNFYASSFRTDRAIPAILSGYPAQPTTSVMKFVDKAERLPSIARSLAEKGGYECSYYYGGDINFVNQKAYLVSSKFSRIICDSDFPLGERLSKWGAHDDKLWQRVWEDVRADNAPEPQFRVVQTSSSHEPFEVPYRSHKFANQRAVAFEYADSCMGAFIDSLRVSPRWEKSLVVIVPDHWGAYPQGLSDPIERHRIPLVVTGGALAPESGGVRIGTAGVQTDIAATLLGLLGIDHDEFTMSKNILDLESGHYAFFSEPDFAAIVSASDSTVVSTHDDRIVRGTDKSADRVRAFLQNLYKDLDAR